MDAGHARQVIRYHRQNHRPALAAPRPGPVSECRMPSCRKFMADLFAEHVRDRTPADAAIVFDGNADQIVADLTEAGWTLSDRTDLVGGKRIRFLSPPPGQNISGCFRCAAANPDDPCERHR